MLSLKETFVEDDVWVLVSVISKKKVVPSSLLNSLPTIRNSLRKQNPVLKYNA